MKILLNLATVFFLLPNILTCCIFAEDFKMEILILFSTETEMRRNAERALKQLRMNQTFSREIVVYPLFAT